MRSRNAGLYISIWEKHHGRKKPRGMHIHYLDGNHRNNDPANLVLCTPEEHRKYHELLGDKVGGNFIKKADWYNNLSPEEKAALSIKKSEASKRRYENQAARDQTSAAGLKRYKDPAQRKRQSESLKNLWKDPSFRDKILLARKLSKENL